ncbi:hypothetical protein B0H13DRAFT_2482908 [Mycena leptocephala]|nr:hypothetical protein B0H13DRAFT_2482908 [Mycena leptocephala]
MTAGFIVRVSLPGSTTLLNTNQPFPISPRNSAAGIFQLLCASSCHRIIATCVTLAPLLAGLKKHIAEADPDFELDIQEMPPLGQIYPNLGAETPDCSFQLIRPRFLPSSRTNWTLFAFFGEYRISQSRSSDPYMLTQSLTFRFALSYGYRMAGSYSTALGSMALRLSICSVFSATFVAPHRRVFCGISPTATLPGALPIVPSPDNILDHARKTKCRALMTVPALLVSWSTSPPDVAYLKTLHTVWGPLPQRIGDALVDAGVHLLAGYGTTEVGPLSVVKEFEEDVKEWAWFRFSDLVKVRWEPQADGTFELHVLTWEKHTPSVENLDNERGYATSDLFINHPQKKHLWKVVGRVDDTIMHSIGEKTVPGPMEDIVAGSPYVAGVVMFGRERPQTGILIETIPSLQIDVQNAVQVAELRNKIWPVIEEANQSAPAFSRIFKEMILFASADKPLPRAGKGTVLRKAAITLYAPEIESIYNTVEEQISLIELIEPPPVWEAALIEAWLLKLGGKICNSTISPRRRQFVRRELVEICTGPGIPLIVFPGVTGRIEPLLALRPHFPGTLWVFQVTKSTPVAPFSFHAQFVVDKIRQKQPNGPYRLAAYSGSSIIGVAVAKLLEESGEQVLQLTFIDGFPFVWTSDTNELLIREPKLTRLINNTIDLLRHDPSTGPIANKSSSVAAAARWNAPLLQFLADFHSPNTQRSDAGSDPTDPFVGWVSSVKAPFCVLIAEHGLLMTMPGGSRGDWADLGAHRCHKAVKQHFIAGVGHMGILADKRTAALLEQY